MWEKSLPKKAMSLFYLLMVSTIVQCSVIVVTLHDDSQSTTLRVPFASLQNKQVCVVINFCATNCTLYFFRCQHSCYVAFKQVLLDAALNKPVGWKAPTFLNVGRWICVSATKTATVWKALVCRIMMQQKRNLTRFVLIFNCLFHTNVLCVIYIELRVNCVWCVSSSRMFFRRMY